MERLKILQFVLNKKVAKDQYEKVIKEIEKEQARQEFFELRPRIKIMLDILDAFREAHVPFNVTGSWWEANTYVSGIYKTTKSPSIQCGNTFRYYNDAEDIIGDYRDATEYRVAIENFIDFEIKFNMLVDNYIKNQTTK